MASTSQEAYITTAKNRKACMLGTCPSIATSMLEARPTCTSELDGQNSPLYLCVVFHIRDATEVFAIQLTLPTVL